MTIYIYLCGCRSDGLTRAVDAKAISTTFEVLGNINSWLSGASKSRDDPSVDFFELKRACVFRTVEF